MKTTQNHLASKSCMNVLSLDGGGIRGLVAATIIAKLEQDLGKQAYQMFDLMVGTSTGGILALGLSLGIPASTLVQVYTTDASRIFCGGGKWFEYTHSDAGLREVLT